VAGVCLLGSTGCFEAPAEAVARLEQVKAEGEALNAELDDVGGRLLGGRAVVTLWQEMGWRHRQVSEIACQNASTHVAAMSKHFERQEQRGKKQRRVRAANAGVVSSAPQKGERSVGN
jgi:hypothetical protein